MQRGLLGGGDGIGNGDGDGDGTGDVGGSTGAGGGSTGPEGGGDELGGLGESGLVHTAVKKSRRPPWLNMVAVVSRLGSERPG